MICSFRVHTKTRIYDTYKETTRTFELCQGDECPFYYVDENDIPKCARCNGPEEEEIL